MLQVAPFHKHWHSQWHPKRMDSLRHTQLRGVVVSIGAHGSFVAIASVRSVAKSQQSETLRWTLRARFAWRWIGSYTGSWGVCCGQMHCYRAPADALHGE